MGVGHTVTEPIRDDEPVWDPYEMVTCPACEGLKQTEHERADGTMIKRACRMCRSTPGQVLRGNPPESPYEITYDFRTHA